MSQFFWVHWYSSTSHWDFLASFPASPSLPFLPRPQKWVSVLGDRTALAACLIQPVLGTTASLGDGGFGRDLRHPQTMSGKPSRAWGSPGGASGSHPCFQGPGSPTLLHQDTLLLSVSCDFIGKKILSDQRKK